MLKNPSKHLRNIVFYHKYTVTVILIEMAKKVDTFKENVIKQIDFRVNPEFRYFRACLKIAFCKMCVIVCGEFVPKSGGVAGYAD